MSYLSGTRLHFAGRFQASVSTVNNDPRHYDADKFKKNWWEFGQGTTNGWWNPPGDADWRLIGCSVTGAYVDDQPADPSDPIFTCSVADSDHSAPAKLVDLDPEQQMVSTVFGLFARIADGAGETLAGGDMVPAPFTDMFTRCPNVGLLGAGAAFRSVLTGVQWAPGAGASDFLRALQAAAGEEGLSICLNVDGYDLDHTSPTFTTGRVVGTIGPALPGEPQHLVLGRHLMAPGGSRLNFCTAVVDEAAGKLRLDLGNALPLATPVGAPADLGPLTLTAGGTELGQVTDYTAAGWYESTAGVVTLPLSEEQLGAARSTPLALSSTDAPVQTVAEASDGVHVRADTFVFRMDPGATADVSIYATKFGVPAEGISIDLTLANGKPADGLAYESPITSGADGIAPLTLTAGRLGQVRPHIDGQVYGVRPTQSDPPPGTIVNHWDLISVLVFSEWAPQEDPVTWCGSLEPIFKQYHALYPVMARFLDLSKYESVVENARPLTLAFSLPIENPNSMPVTRDLSTAKRNAILTWLASSPPPLGEAVTAQEAAPPADTAVVAEAAPPAPPLSEEYAHLANIKSGRVRPELDEPEGTA